MQLPSDLTPTSPRRRVLVIEDHADSRDMLRMLLELEGHEILEAAGGAEAVKIILDEPVDVALIDLSLPDLDGLQIARHTRLLALSPRPFLVAVTGWVRDEDRERTREAGFDAHLSKPVTPEALADIFRALG
ncbi:MAG TPA: response regulator [Candidatus Binatia bacterium]|nr:response regulator [Candidatus Binatia bacterium]